MRAALGLDSKVRKLTPPEFDPGDPAGPADLLWNGGVGTYVKASTRQREVGDKANDRCGWTCQLRVRVIGEGGNLG